MKNWIIVLMLLAIILAIILYVLNRRNPTEISPPYETAEDVFSRDSFSQKIYN